MYKKLKKNIKRKLYKKYFSEFRTSKNKNYSDFSETERKIVAQVKPYTMTTPERIVSLIRAVEYIEVNNIQGSLVECGVWKGGSMMAAIVSLSDKKRQIFLYDTFKGMSAPSAKDESYKNESAQKAYEVKDEYWKRIECLSTLEEVQNNIQSLTYPKDKIHYIKGKVEDTIPNIIPDKIAILRLDTDWYESTMHEMIHLFPRLVKGGVIIIDDYGHWRGCKQAIDEYIAKNNIKLLLNRIDYTGRIAIKL